MAVLFSQLPRESRTVRKMEPSCAWGDSEYILREIEHGIRGLAWMQTKDAQRGLNFPDKIMSPAEVAEAQRKAAAAFDARDEIDRILGLGGDDG